MPTTNAARSARQRRRNDQENDGTALRAARCTALPVNEPAQARRNVGQATDLFGVTRCGTSGASDKRQQR